MFKTTAIYMVCAGAGSLTALLGAQATEVVLHSFGCPPRGANPGAGLIRDAAGKLYGTTLSGGKDNLGVVFSLNTAGQQSILYTFTGGANGAGGGAVVLDASGNVYGTAVGGASGFGLVYKLDTAGKQTVLYSFTGGADGGTPTGSLIRDSAGTLYGTTYGGGTANAGVVYTVNSSGQETVLYSFSGGVDGARPAGGVVRDSAGNLYGTTSGGGSAGYGTVFELNRSGQETVLYSFTAGLDGDNPQAGVTLDSAGNLYGTTAGGGPVGAGSVYKVSTTGQETVLYDFTGGLDGSLPYAGVIRDSAGNLYGTTVSGGSGLGVVYKVDAAGQETVLQTFTGANGSEPSGGDLAMDSSGNLYGATQFGNVANTGVVYKVSASGQASVLYAFPGDAGGADPLAALIGDSAGNLYGTAYSGGATDLGVVFKVDSAGKETVLYTFAGGSDGANPEGGVVQDTAGNFYGTTVYGGPANAGVVYKLDTNGNETELYSFTGGGDGGSPYSGVVVDSAGNLFGTTYGGGQAGAGGVYKVSPTGQETVLYSFSGGADGAHPWGGVIRDSAGNLYGTTQLGGQSECGVVYRLDTAGHETVLHSFDITDGAQPMSGVIRDSAGNLYGTTAGGGPSGLGEVYKLDTAGQVTVLAGLDNPTAGVILDSAGNLYGTSQRWTTGVGAGIVFKVDASGHFTVLYKFKGRADGGGPVGGLFSDTAGIFYGTTSYGGANNSGVVFEIELTAP